jgi:hypothetical protein
MGFGLVIGFIDHLQIVTASNCNTISDFHFTNHSTVVFPVYFHKSSLSVSWQRIYNAGTIKSLTKLHTHSIAVLQNMWSHTLSLLRLLTPWILIYDYWLNWTLILSYVVVFPFSWLCCSFKLAPLYRRGTDQAAQKTQPWLGHTENTCLHHFLYCCVTLPRTRECV